MTEETVLADCLMLIAIRICSADFLITYFLGNNIKSNYNISVKIELTIPLVSFFIK